MTAGLSQSRLGEQKRRRWLTLVSTSCRDDQRSGYDTRRNVRDRMAAAPRGPPAVGAAPSAHGRCLPPRLAQSNTAFTYTSTVPASTDKGLHAISRPVHSVYGWHILEVMAITPARLTSFASAKASIKTERPNKALALPTRWSASTSRSRPSRGQRGSALRRADRHIRDSFERAAPGLPSKPLRWIKWPGHVLAKHYCSRLAHRARSRT